jgi:hypothetical protein
VTVTSFARTAVHLPSFRHRQQPEKEEHEETAKDMKNCG